MTRRTQFRRLTRRLLRWGRLALCVSLAVFLSMDPNLVHRQIAIAQTKAEVEAKQEAELKELADRLEKMFSALKEAQKEIPRDTWDPEVIIHGQQEAGIEGIGTDPEDIFAWVRDNTYLVPYQGVLRDYRGVLMDRVGNSLDRSLLLLVLLETAGHKNLQLAYAELPEEEAERLLNDARPIPDEGALPQTKSTTEDLAKQLENYAEKYDLDPADMQQAFDKINLRSQRLAVEAVQRTHEQSQALLEMLREKDLVPSREVQMEKLRSDAKEDFTHHWWVQLQKGVAGGGGPFGGLLGGGAEVVNLDPSLPSADPGDTLVKPQKIVPGTEITQRLWNQRHTVQIRIIIERWDDGELEEVPVLSQELFPAAHIGERIALHHAPSPNNWPADLHLMEEDKPLEKFKELVLKQDEWLPILTISDSRRNKEGERQKDRKIGKYGFTASGMITQPDLPGFAQNVLASRKLAAGMEDGAKISGGRIKKLLNRTETFGGEPRKPETTQELDPEPPIGDSKLTAEWIEYEIRQPGEKPKTVRRQIFDLIGPAARPTANEPPDKYVAEPEYDKQQELNRGLALLGDTDILALAADISPDFVSSLLFERMLDNKEPIMTAFQGGTRQSSEVLKDIFAELTPLPGNPYKYALVQQAWSQQRNDVYIGCVNLVSEHLRPYHNAKSGIVIRYILDVVANETNVSISTNKNPFRIRLLAGVLDTNSEALLLPESNPNENTASSFEAISGIWRVLTRDETRNPLNIEKNNDTVSRIRDDLERGNVVVAPIESLEPDRNKQRTWWRINAETGTTLGIGPDGYGQTATEYKISIAMMSIGLIAAIFCPDDPKSEIVGWLCWDCTLFAFGLVGFIWGLIMFALAPAVFWLVYMVVVTGTSLGQGAGKCIERLFESEEKRSNIEIPTRKY